MIKGEKEKSMEKQASMEMENASPELEQERADLSNKDEIYPYNHATIDHEDDKVFYCKFCGSRIPIENGKVLFCMYCGGRITEDESEIIIDTVYASPKFMEGKRELITANVYASPEFMEVKRDLITADVYASPKFTGKKSLLSMIRDLLKRK